MFKLNREFGNDIFFCVTLAEKFNDKAKLIIGNPFPISSFQSDVYFKGVDSWKSQYSIS